MSGPDAHFWQRVEREAASLRPTRLTPGLVNWGSGPDRNKLWIAEDLTPLAETEIYGDLTDEQKLGYNQYYALEMSEQFIWLESFAIIPPLQGLLKGDIPNPALRILLRSFIVDEENHLATVWQLLRLARHDLYPRNEFCFFKPPAMIGWMAATASRLPRLLSGWALFAGSLEEQTIPISRSYKEAGDSVDPLFANIFTLHSLDEARHCKLDSLIAEWLIAPQAAVPKWINGKVLATLYKAYHDTGWGCDAPICQLIADFPQLKDRESDMITATKHARSGHHIQHMLDASLHPLTARNAKRYKMLDRAIRGVAGTGAN